ncbi:carbohydrate ABC transporter permease [Arthrobacter sp. KNU-44]|uniref:carbohydrate ABC transporter permease n=1 Tax=Arthrobacter sp. KNU-44 TaxID=3450744 RepID=UPI003F43BA48
MSQRVASVETEKQHKPEPQPRRRRRRIQILPYALITPLMIFIVGLALVPAGFTVIQSFFTVNPMDPPTRFSGLDNFTSLLNDATILSSASNTVIYLVVGVLVSTVLGIFMAVILHRNFRGRSIVIAVMILPWALPGVVEGLVWGGIYDPNSGLLNSVLSSLHLIDHYQVFVGQDHLLTIILIELVQVWQMTPLSALLILAVLQVIPSELYEAARIDGCSTWKAFCRITLPLARAGIAIAMVQASVATLNVFDQPYVLNGAASNGASIMMQAYFISFQNLNFGQGYALSLLITIVTMAISLLVVRTVYRKVEF